MQAVRRRPRSLGLPFSLWTLHRLADYMAEQTGIRVEYETVRVHLKAQGIVLSRPQHTITSPDPSTPSKKGDRRGPRRPPSGRPFLLRRRVQPELDAHPQGDVGPQGSAGDDPHPSPTQEALRHRSSRLPQRPDGGAIRRRKRRREIAELLEALLEKHPRGTVYVAWDNSNTHQDEEVERSCAGRRVGWWCSTCRPTALG